MASTIQSLSLPQRNTTQQIDQTDIFLVYIVSYYLENLEENQTKISTIYALLLSYEDLNVKGHPRSPQNPYILEEYELKM